MQRSGWHAILDNFKKHTENNRSSLSKVQYIKLPNSIYNYWAVPIFVNIIK